MRFISDRLQQKSRRGWTQSSLFFRACFALRVASGRQSSVADRQRRAPNAWTMQLAAAKKQARLQNKPLLVACVDFVSCG